MRSMGGSGVEESWLVDKSSKRFEADESASKHGSFCSKIIKIYICRVERYIRRHILSPFFFSILFDEFLRFTEV